MEDAVSIVGDFAGSGSAYYAIFDGHRGSDVSTYAANNVHRVFNRKHGADSPIAETLYLTVGEVNDYLRTKWPEQGSTGAIAIVIKDRIYTANTGDSRILVMDAQGGVHQVSEEHKINDGSVHGLSALSRSLGDGGLARNGEPYMTETHRKDGMWMIIASHGLWTVLTNDQAARIGASKTTAQASANALKDAAIKRGAKDNVSVIVVYLTPK
jgi:serine/threonine protein phosphatase PrpC